MSRRLTQHSELGPKLDIRKTLLYLLPEPPRILETHAGAGDIAKALEYHRAELHTPIDNNRQFTGVINWDSREVVRALDLNRYNYFDVDAYGSPLEWCYLIASRHNNQRPFVLALTCGAFTSRHKVSHTYRQAGFSQQMLDAVGGPSQFTPFAGSFREDEHTIPLFEKCLKHWTGRAATNIFVTESFDRKNKGKRTAWNIGFFYGRP